MAGYCLRTLAKVGRRRPTRTILAPRTTRSSWSLSSRSSTLTVPNLKDNSSSHLCPRTALQLSVMSPYLTRTLNDTDLAAIPRHRHARPAPTCTVTVPLARHRDRPAGRHPPPCFVQPHSSWRLLEIRRLPPCRARHGACPCSSQVPSVGLLTGTCQ
jgi:hypothetical protein